MKAKYWIVCKSFDGMPKQTDFELKEEELRAIKDGEFLCEALYLSIDPYMRLFGNVCGATMIGEQVAKVIESKHDKFPVGSTVAVTSGWRSHTISDGSNARIVNVPSPLPLSLSLGILGMPGGTAYFGLKHVGKVKRGDVVFVNGAAGTVGSVVGQLAKSEGCTVIGCASTEAKLNYLREIGFDHVFNYKTQDLDKALKQAAPDGLDIFYDNVGSAASCQVLKHMKSRGRVLICGTMAGYNDKDGPGTNQTGPLPFSDILLKELVVEGFTFWRFIENRAEAEKALYKLICEGKLHYKENIYQGFDKMVPAFLDMLAAKHLGKPVVKV